MKSSTAIMLAFAMTEASILSKPTASVSPQSDSILAPSGAFIKDNSRSNLPSQFLSEDTVPTASRPAIYTSTSTSYPLLLNAPAQPKTLPAFPSGLEWMKGHSMLIIMLVSNGRLAIADIPPPGQEHLIYPHFEDVVLASVNIDAMAGERKSFRDVYGNVKTEEDYEAYLEAEKSMPKPHCGQVQCPFVKQD
jgi:hypothetical protein